MIGIGDEAVYAAMGRESGDGFVFSDREGIIRLWNGGAERIFGFTASEAVGQSLDLIIPENLRQRHWEGYRRVMDTGLSGYGTRLLATPALCRDGGRISIEFSMVVVRNCGGVIGCGSIVRDVTARWENERAQRKRLAELEGLLSGKE